MHIFQAALCAGDHHGAYKRCRSLFDDTIESAKLIFCVTRIGSNWVLYDVDFDEESIMIYTSKPTRQGLGTQINRELPWVRQFIGWRLDDKKFLKYKLDWVENLARETKPEDSGILVLRFITCLMLRKPSSSCVLVISPLLS
jgi:hypothetical protein